jgi:ABC-type multidrug transport system fused ATPase/permease subunit
MGNDYIYWTFSAAAQSISALVAFLLTGYALVHTFMQAAREKDDSLDEIHSALLLIYHKRLTNLAWLTGASVILSLFVVYLNRSGAAIFGLFVIIVGIIDLIAIITALAFVVSIVDPSKYRKAAEKELESIQARQTAPAAEFFDAFRNLERLVRDYLRDKELYVPSRGAPRMSYSFRQMIDALIENEKIDHRFFEELIEINKYRNLVFHGHVDDADLVMLEKTRKAAERVKQLE